MSVICFAGQQPTRGEDARSLDHAKRPVNSQEWVFGIPLCGYAGLSLLGYITGPIGQPHTLFHDLGQRQARRHRPGLDTRQRGAVSASAGFDAAGLPPPSALKPSNLSDLSDQPYRPPNSQLTNGKKPQETTQQAGYLRNYNGNIPPCGY